VMIQVLESRNPPPPAPAASPRPRRRERSRAPAGFRMARLLFAPQTTPVADFPVADISLHPEKAIN